MEEQKFKVGDTVYVVTRSYKGNGYSHIESMSTDKVKTITAKRGIVKLEKYQTEFKLDGYPSKSEGFSTYSTTLEPWSLDLLREIRVAKIIRAAHALTFKQVSEMDNDDQIALYDALKLKMGSKESIEE